MTALWILPVSIESLISGSPHPSKPYCVAWALDGFRNPKPPSTVLAQPFPVTPKIIAGVPYSLILGGFSGNFLCDWYFSEHVCLLWATWPTYTHTQTHTHTLLFFNQIKSSGKICTNTMLQVSLPTVLVMGSMPGFYSDSATFPAPTWALWFKSQWFGNLPITTVYFLLYLSISVQPSAPYRQLCIIYFPLASPWKLHKLLVTCAHHCSCPHAPCPHSWQLQRWWQKSISCFNISAPNLTSTPFSPHFSYSWQGEGFQTEAIDSWD